MPARGPTISRQAKAGVTLSVARINKLIRKSQATYVSSRAPLYVAGVMETIVDSVVKRAVENVRNQRNGGGGLMGNRVNNVDVINAVRSDPDLARLCVGFAFASNARAPPWIDLLAPGYAHRPFRSDRQPRRPRAAATAAN